MADPNQAYYGQPGGYPQPGYPPPQQGGYPQGGYPQGGYPQGGYPQGGGYPQAGYPASGYPQSGYTPGPPPGGYVPQPGFVPPAADGYGSSYRDPDGTDDGVKGFEFTDKTIRQAFIRKVYSILMIQLLITFGFVSLFTFHEGTKLWAYQNKFMVWIALGVMFTTMIAMVCCESVRRQSPMNVIFLGLFTLAEGFLLGVTAGRYKTEAVVMAVGITAVVCLALTLFALQTKYDFTVCGGILLVILVVFVLFGIIAIFMPGRTMTLVYSSCGAILFSFYLIYDTQMMMGGNHKYSISPEEYIFAALALYLDIINIFLYILAIIGASKN